MRRLTLLLTILLFGSAAHAGPGRDAFEKFMQGLVTLDARFEQTVLDTENSRQGLSRGVFQLKRPGRFRWDYVSPEKKELIADGRDLWIVDDELNHITQLRQSMALKGTPAQLLLSSEPIDKSFEVVELGEKLGMQWLELLPRDKDGNIVRVLLAFKGDKLLRLELSDKFGQITRFSFFDIKRNQEIPDSVFTYTPPPGWNPLDIDT